MDERTWRRLVAEQLKEAGEAVDDGRDSDCAREFGVAVGYLQSAARGGDAKAAGLLARLRDQTTGDEETQQLRLEPEQLQRLARLDDDGDG